MPCLRRACSYCYIAGCVRDLQLIGGHERVAAAIKLDSSRYFLCAGKTAVGVEPERDYRVGEAVPFGMLPYSVAGAGQGWIARARCRHDASGQETLQAQEVS